MSNSSCHTVLIFGFRWHATLKIRTHAATSPKRSLWDCMEMALKASAFCLQLDKNMSPIWSWWAHMICHGIPGKQKFELLLLQFPMCPSSSTFDNRIMQPSCNNTEFAVATSNISIQSSPHCCAAAHGTPRLSVINTNYSKDEARLKCLEAVAWSLNCLSALDDY